MTKSANAKVDVDVSGLGGADVNEFGGLGVEARGLDADGIAAARG